MATLSINTKVIYDGRFTGSGALNDPEVPVTFSMVQTWANGSGDNQANQFWQLSSNANATPTVFDLDAGTLLDDFGTALTFTTLKGILIRNKSTTAAEVLTIAGDFIQTVVMSGTTPTFKLHPNGVLYFTSPLDEYDVAAGTGDQISLDPGSDNISFDIVLIGTV